MDVIKDWIQWANLLIFAASLFVAVVAFFRLPRSRVYFLPLSMLALHATLFYAAVQFDIAPYYIRTLWSSTLRLHSALMLLAFLVVFWNGSVMVKDD